jgi:hypothetical protein
MQPSTGARCVFSGCRHRAVAIRGLCEQHEHTDARRLMVQPSRNGTVLDRYRNHVDQFGSECVFESASGLDDKDRARLAAYIAHKQRVSRFRHGQWVHTGQEIRACEACGKDLPNAAGPRMRFHAHCRERRKRRKQRSDDG